jgi:predicted aspartyl protease
MTALSLVVSAKVGSGKKTLTRRVAIDTGFTMGLWMSKEDAVAAGGVLVDPVTLPTDAIKRVIPGKATILRVRIPDAQVEAETLVFCPDKPPPDILVGIYFLNQVGASLTIGQLTFKMPVKPIPNRGGIDVYNLGDHIVPGGRPVRW